jgi:predicted nucleotidyltransferase
MDQIFKNNAYKILELFIELPTKEFSIRGIARHLNLSHVTVIKHIGTLYTKEFIKKKEETLYPTYFANTENQRYKYYKKNYLISKLIDSGIIEYIQKEVLPSSIVLFGSGAKATFTKSSDIDIFVEAKETKLKLMKYEKKLNKKVNLLFEENIHNLSKELKNNIINGELLYGFIRIK